MFVRQEMYRHQTDEPRSANLAKHMHVNKVSLPTNVQIVKVLDINFQVKKIGVHSEVHEWIALKTLTDRANIEIYDTLSQICAFHWHICIRP